MPPLSLESVAEYLASFYGKPVRVLSITEQGRTELAGDLKAFGYGTPLFLLYEVDGRQMRAVLETMAPSSFGHDHFSDRAQAILWEHTAFSRLPRHVRSLDSGAILGSGKLLSTGNAEEFFLLTEFVEGNGYFKDLDRLSAGGSAAPLDRERATALATYLASIHSQKNTDAPQLYVRRIRDLLGHGECIMGLIDNYPDHYGFIDQELLHRIESACVEWRWKLKHRSRRLSQVHGDFHPWNILFRSGADFTVLDRSRGEWGEPADDVTCLSINYLFSSLLRSGRLEGDLDRLFRLFWDTYLEQSGDRELPEVAAPFYAWRGLVIASPVWYPRLPDNVRRSVFTFIENVLAADRFDPSRVNAYLGPSG